MTRKLMALPVALLLGACASSGINPERLAITAYQGLGEARTQARGWSTDARLRYVEGEGVMADGKVEPGDGYWRYVYDAPNKSQQLAVIVTPTDVQAEERAAQSPPGFVIGDRTLGTGWVDSDQVIQSLPAAATAPSEGFSLLLVPTTPAQWIVRGAEQRWKLDASSGEVLP